VLFEYGIYVCGGGGDAQRRDRQPGEEGPGREGKRSEAGEKKTSVRFMEADIYTVLSTA
jgi:hypothetical protein